MGGAVRTDHSSAMSAHSCFVPASMLCSRLARWSARGCVGDYRQLCRLHAYRACGKLDLQLCRPEWQDAELINPLADLLTQHGEMAVAAQLRLDAAQMKASRAQPKGFTTVTAVPSQDPVAGADKEARAAWQFNSTWSASASAAFERQIMPW